MPRIYLLVLALLLSAGCSKSPIAIQDEASKAFERGRAEEAITILERDWDHSDYVIGNFLAFLYMREQYYSNVPGGYRKALDTLPLVKLPPDNFPIVDVYLDLLRFNALSLNGDAQSADDLMDKYCARTMEAADRRFCIRTKVAKVLLHLYKAPGHDTRFYKEFLAMSRAACVKTYDWDAIMSRAEVQLEEAKSVESPSN
jgi:hypothetical protein